MKMSHICGDRLYLFKLFLRWILNEAIITSRGKSYCKPVGIYSKTGTNTEILMRHFEAQWMALKRFSMKIVENGKLMLQYLSATLQHETLFDLPKSGSSFAINPRISLPWTLVSNVNLFADVCDTMSLCPC